MGYPGNMENTNDDKVNIQKGIDGQFKTLIENVSTPIFVVQQGRYVYVNPPFEKITGYNAEELYAINSSTDVIDPEHKQMIKEMLLTGKNGSEPQPNREIKIINKDGEIRWIAYNEAEIDYGGKPAILGSGIDITERKRAEEISRNVELVYRTIFEKSGTSMMILEEDMLISLANGEFEKLVGYTKEEIENKIKWIDFVTDDDLSTMKEYHRKRRIDSASVPAQYEFKLITRWGDLKDIHVRIAIIPGTKKSVASFTDITERKRAEEALKRSEEKYRNLINNSHDIIYTLNPEGVFTFVSSGWTMLLGHQLNQVLGKPFQPFVHPDDIAGCEYFLKKMIETGQQQSGVEYRVQHVDGSWRWHNTNAMPLRDETGTIIGLEGNASDITARKQAIIESKELEEMLRKSESRYRSLTEDMEALVCIFLPDGTLTYVNRVCCEYFQKNPDELVGHNFLDFLPNETIRQEVAKNYRSLTIDQPIQTHEQPVIAPDGTEIWQRWINRAIFNDKAELIYYQSIGIDITERKRAEEELQAANEQMEATLEELMATEEELRTQYQQLQEQEQALRDSEQRLADIINFLPDPTLVINKEGQITVWNQAAEEMTGIKTIDILGKGDYEYALPFYGVRRPILIDQVLCPDEETGRRYYTQYRDKENIMAETDLTVVQGEPRFLSGKASPLYDTRGNLVGAIESMRDMTDRKAIERALEEEKELLKTTLLSIGDGVISTDNKGAVKLINKVAEQLTGWTKEESFGKPLEEVFYICNEFTRERCINPVREVLETGRTIEIANHTILISKDGIEIPIEDSAAAIKDEDGKINGVVLVFRDFTEKKERQEKIEYLSYHDYLTGLYNRRFFEEELKRLDTERNLPITLVMADVNGLKLTNDAFGHLAGDRLLRKVAEVMKKECRNDDIIARVGGDEFMFLLPNTDAEEAKIIVKRINGTLAQEKIGSIIPSVSFGCATKHAAAEVMSKVSKQAEDNMYRRKLSESSSMRNRIIKVIIGTLYEKNKREEQHSQRVSELCAAIGLALDIGAADLGELRTGGLLHDIGKITLDEMILNKPGKLDNSEWLEIKRHSETGYRILSSVNEFSQLAEYVLAHHERWDGKGYPKGLKGTEIPLQARIMALADAYDAMTSDRPYRKALSEDIVIAEIKRNAGKQFDPDIAQLFLEKVLVNQ